MKVIVVIGVLVCISVSQAFIVPDELPSVLSVIYSNIPTLKKGTDSRLGWGFRLGDRADFQVMLELGPQTNTQPLANQGEGNTSSKRNTLNTVAATLYAQRQHEKKEREQKLQKEKKKALASPGEENSSGAEWLKSWRKTVSKTNGSTGIHLKAKPGLAIGEIDAKSVIPDDSDQSPQAKLSVLSEVPATAAPTVKPESSTFKEEALDDVDLE